VIVQATLQAAAGFGGPTVFTAQSGSDGSYRIGPVPSGDYVVQITPVPNGFTSPTPGTARVTVASGQDVSGTSFTLTPSTTPGPGPGPGPGPTNPTLPAGVSLVALPGDYSDIDIPTLLGLPADQVRFVAFNTPSSQYVFYAAPPADRFRLGEGYFINLANPATLTTTRPVPTAPVEVPVNPGWELVGHVGTTAVPLAQVQVRVGSQTPITFPQAVSQGIIRPGVYKLDPGSSYAQTDQLEPFKAVWIRVVQAATLIIPPAPGVAAASARGTGTVSAPKTASFDWRLPLVARVGDLVDQASVGVSSGASAAFNPLLDLERPPHFSSNGRYLSLAFPHRDWGPGAAGEYAVDIRGRSTGTQIWEFVVQTNVPTESVTLTWPGVGAVSPEVDLVLVDVASGQQRNLRGSSSYTFGTGPHGAERRFRLIVRSLNGRRPSL
jgi:hypothetical protein